MYVQVLTLPAGGVEDGYACWLVDEQQASLITLPWVSIRDSLAI